MVVIKYLLIISLCKWYCSFPDVSNIGRVHVCTTFLNQLWLLSGTIMCMQGDVIRWLFMPECWVVFTLVSFWTYHVYCQPLYVEERKGKPLLRARQNFSTTNCVHKRMNSSTTSVVRPWDIKCWHVNCDSGKSSGRCILSVYGSCVMSAPIQTLL